MPATVIAYVRGCEVQIDEEDAHLLDEYAWTIRRTRGRPVVIRITYEAGGSAGGSTGGRRKHIQYLHHEILAQQPPMRVHWRDNNRLNVTRENLYLANTADAVVAAVRRRGHWKWPCPFSPDRLREMYWIEKRLLSDIGAAAAEILGRDDVPAPGTVQNWLIKAGVNRRSFAQIARERLCQEYAAKTGMFSPAAQERSALAARDRCRPMIANGDLLPWRSQPPAVRRKIGQKVRQAWARKRAADPTHVEVACAFCSAVLLRPRWRVVRQPQHWCSQSCYMKWRNRDREPRRETRPCDWCAAPITRMPSQFRRAGSFCDVACANRWRAANRPESYQQTPDAIRACAERLRRSAQARDTRLQVPCARPGCPNVVYVPRHIRESGRRVTCSHECARYVAVAVRAANYARLSAERVAIVASRLEAQAEGARGWVFSPAALRALRLSLGLTAGEMGRVIGAATPAVRGWEYGQRVPRAQTQSVLARLAALQGAGWCGMVRESGRNPGTQ